MAQKKVGVIGSGTMGNGIAHVFAQNNYPVKLVDINEDILKQAKDKIQKNMQRQVKKEIISTEQMEKALSLITFVTNIEDLIEDINQALS